MDIDIDRMSSAPKTSFPFMVEINGVFQRDKIEIQLQNLNNIFRQMEQ